MGLFGKLFEKKYCDICGSEIKLLGNRKLADGNLCKHCAAKLSPFFDDRRHTTVEGIREHLRYREENQAAVAAFHPTRTMGVSPKIHIDEDAGTFIVTPYSAWQDENPDVIPLKDIADVTVDVRESRSELKQEKKTADGKTERVSYNPPRYKYEYTFWLKILMNQDFRWFDDITFSVNDGDITLDSYSSMGRRNVGASSAVNPYTSVKYRETDRRANEIRQTLLEGRAASRNASSAPAARAAAPVCPYCGAAQTGSAAFCTNCGAPLK